MIDPRRLGEILTSEFGLDSAELEKALGFQKEYGGRLGEILLHSGVITEEQLMEALGLQTGFPDLRTLGAEPIQSPPPPLGGVAPSWYLSNGALPLMQVDGEIRLLMRDPFDSHILEAVGRIYPEKRIRPFIADERRYRDAESRFRDLFLEKSAPAFNESEVEHLRDLAAEAPVIRMVNAMISRAAEQRASDIHLENHKEHLNVRYRIDGVLHDVDQVMSQTAMAMVSRIKILAELDIGEKRLPQDGRIRARLSGQGYDIRVSTLPTIHGENVVLRLLESESVDYELDRLGLGCMHEQSMQRLLANSFGLILVTGPTGSGKSTTLYSLLNRLNTRERKIVTVEDPVEYQLEGISQIQVHESIGLTFAGILRNILRQDPDVIMIGEIRDRETAEIAIRASLTGHLVLATLHTNDSLSAITRLVDMGVDDYLVYSSLLGIVAQRLVRRLCRECRVPDPQGRERFDPLGKGDLPTGSAGMDKPMYRAQGCDACVGTGYHGRTGVFEFLEVTPGIRDRLRAGDVDGLRADLKKSGFRTLRDDAVLKWFDGITTADEVLRVT